MKITNTAKNNLLSRHKKQADLRMHTLNKNQAVLSMHPSIFNAVESKAPFFWE